MQGILASFWKKTAALWGVRSNPSSNFGAAFLGYLRGPRLVGKELRPSLWALCL